MICIVYVHISWCHNYPYDILVHVQTGEIATCTEKRLSECVKKAEDKKETAEVECDLVKEKARELKPLLVPGVEMCDDELEDLVAEIENYKKSMQVAEKGNESKYISIYGCSCNNTWSTWWGQKSAI